jgi:RNase P subunit RPR2
MPCTKHIRSHSFQWVRHTTKGRSTGHTTRVAKRSTIIIACVKCGTRVRFRVSDDRPYEVLSPKED